MHPSFKYLAVFLLLWQLAPVGRTQAAKKDTLIFFCKTHPCFLSLPEKFIPNHQEITSYLHCDKDNVAFKDFHIIIFDRWGNQVYISDSPFETWSGKIKDAWAPDGYYTWKITLALKEPCEGNIDAVFTGEIEIFY